MAVAGGGDGGNFTAIARVRRCNTHGWGGPLASGCLRVESREIQVCFFFSLFPSPPGPLTALRKYQLRHRLRAAIGGVGARRPYWLDGTPRPRPFFIHNVPAAAAATGFNRVVVRRRRRRRRNQFEYCRRDARTLRAGPLSPRCRCRRRRCRAGVR